MGINELLEQSLQGFVPEDAEVELLGNSMNDAHFLLSDVDGDGQSEIIILMENKDRNYLAVLDKNNTDAWTLTYARSIGDSERKEGYWKNLDEIEVVSSVLEKNNKALSAERLFFHDDFLNFIAIIGNVKYNAKVKLYPNLLVSPAIQILKNQMPKEAKELSGSLTDELKKVELPPDSASIVKTIAAEPYNEPATTDFVVNPLNPGYPVTPNIPRPDIPVGPNVTTPNLPVGPNTSTPEVGGPVIPLPNENTPVAPVGTVLSATSPSYVLGAQMGADDVILDQKLGNVKSGSTSEIIKLVGRRIGDVSGYCADMYLFVETGQGEPSIRINLPVTAGYNPSLQVGYFSGEAYKDISVKIEPNPYADPITTGLSFFVYSFNTGSLKMIFNSQQFNVSFGGMTLVGNGYGQIMPLSQVYYEDIDNAQSLVTIQAILGLNNQTVLGYINMALKFDYQANGLKVYSQSITQGVDPLKEPNSIATSQEATTAANTPVTIPSNIKVAPVSNEETINANTPMTIPSAIKVAPLGDDKTEATSNGVAAITTAKEDMPVAEPNKKPGSYIVGAKISPEYTILDSKVGNIKGGSHTETVSLVGKTTSVEKYFTALTLFIESSDANTPTMQIILPYTTGYDPTLELVNFSGEAYLDTVVKIEADHTDTNSEIFIYSFNTGSLRMIFDSRDFNVQFIGDVTYADDYKVKVALSTGKKFVLDISQIKLNLSSIYSKDGKLIAPTTGQVRPLNKIEFLQYWKEPTKNLVVVQPITGPNPGDVIGYVETVFVFNYEINALVVYDQEAVLVGTPFLV
ncbi:hypothetical protein [Candidatus Epulonipiscium viviparus]|uniref:hypothetical protein n=1 Tax=Candidatus Epulonipiscium viviparus TaxID=420336 RepID=UPI000495F2CB|nr:hypothetical protein [Candidatus Epulopiscium viviparus]